MGLTRGGIDGAISGALGNLALTAAAESTWRKGIGDTLTTFGAALLQGAFIGGATGSLVSGTMSAGGAKLAKTSVGKATGNLGKIGIAAEDLGAMSQQNLARLNQVDNALLAGDEAKARALFQSLKESLDPQTAGRYEASLFEEGRLARLKSAGKSAEGPAEVHGEFLDDLHSNRSGEQELGEVSPVKGIRKKLLKLVGGDLKRAIQFTDEEILDFVEHSSALGFGGEDIEAILMVKIRKLWVDLDTLKKVAESLAEKSKSNTIVFKEPWNFMEAYRVAQRQMLIGRALDPKEYLEPSYINRHLGEFEGKASYFVPNDKYERFVEPDNIERLGWADGQFVSTPSKVDQALAKADGNIAIVEIEMGITEGSWQNKGGLWRIDVHADGVENLRLPTGFENAANEFWHPGGFTSGNAIEGVVDQIQKVKTSREQVIFE